MRSEFMSTGMLARVPRRRGSLIQDMPVDIHELVDGDDEDLHERTGIDPIASSGRSTTGEPFGKKHADVSAIDRSTAIQIR